MDHDAKEAACDGSEFKRGRDVEEEVDADEEVAKRPAPEEDEIESLWDSTPQLTQSESDAHSELSAETALASPSVQLRPGYTAFVCAQYITAWNAMCGQPQAAIGNGSSAAELLQNGLSAEKRLMVVERSADTKGYKRSDALKALTAVHQTIRTERARLEVVLEASGHQSSMSKLTNSEEPTGRCDSARLI
jgi:hypothetical protein